MIEDKIKVMMRDFNPWWEDKPIPIFPFQREVLAKVRGFLKSKQIIAITGLRRVGKTTIMIQVASEVKVPKKNIFYFLFDDLIAQNSDVLADVLDYYLKTVAGEGRKYIFLDEIQKVSYWQDVVKRYYDTRLDLKFIVSGSSSLNIKKSKESLAGRVFDVYVPILSFREFLELNGIKMEKASLETLSKYYEENIHKKPELDDMLKQYLWKGAFPETAVEEKQEFVQEYIRSSVIEKMIYEDIPAVFDVRYKDVLMAVLEYCAKETSNLLDFTNLGKSLSVNYLTIRSYVFYLTNSFVLDVTPNYSGSIIKQMRRSKKVHIAHPSISLALLRYKENILDVEEIAGRFIETVAFQHAKLLADRVFFWRSPQKEEVDLVMEKDGFILAEVKFRRTVESSDAKTLVKLMSKLKTERGFIITRDLFAERVVRGKKILFMPVWLFLLMI